MLFLPLILFSLFAVPGLFGAQGHLVRPFVCACEKKIINGPVQWLTWGQEGPGLESMVLLHVGGQGKNDAMLEVPNLERRERLKAAFFPDTVVASRHKLIFDTRENSLAGLRDEMVERTVAGIMKPEVKNRIQCSMLSETGYYFAVGLDDGTVQLYHRPLVETWSHWLWATLRKPKVYSTLLVCVGIALMCSGYYRWWKKHRLPLVR